eukprot:2425624-Lingulodinium_polyedra.AAC.1
MGYCSKHVVRTPGAAQARSPIILARRASLGGAGSACVREESEEGTEEGVGGQERNGGTAGTAGCVGALGA